jgi:transposase
MAYRYGDRTQMDLFPPCLNDYVPADAPVRAYDAFVEALALDALGIVWAPRQVGNSSYDPKAMLKLLVYGYSYGIRSSRKLERECHYNVAFMWLLGGMKPDHKTIAEFRRRNRGALKQVLSQCVRMCVKLDLIAGNVLFLDGSRMRANAAVERSWTPEKARTVLAEIDGRVEKLLSECEAVDAEEHQMDSLVRMKAELADQQELRRRVRSILEDLEHSGKASINTTDGDCVRIHSRQGCHAGYTGQIVSDDQNKLIVSGDVVGANNDLGQFTTQIQTAQAVLEKPCQSACADAGYADYDDLGRQELEPVDVIIPSQKQAQQAVSGPFDKSRFRYESRDDCYVCPTGHRLRCSGYERKRQRRYYTGGLTCVGCPHFGHCTTDRINGRKVTRQDNEEVRQRLEQRYQQPDAQAIYARRKNTVEHTFGHFKRNLGAGHFLLRGLDGVRAEWSLLACGFNLTRLIRILGVTGLIKKLTFVAAH